MNQFSFTEDMALYKTKISFHDLARVIDSFLTIEKTEFRIKLIIYEADLIKKIKENIEKLNPSLNGKVIFKDENFCSFELNGYFGRKIKTNIAGKFILLPHPFKKNVWIILTNANRLFIIKPLQKLLESIRPRITKPLIITKQLENLLTGFQKLSVVKDIRIKQIGQRGKIKSKGATKNIETDRKWTDLDIKEVFSEARQEGHWITDISFEYIASETERLGSIKLDRNGEITFRGEAKQSFYHFINKASDFAVERYNFLKNRDKTSENNYTSRPFIIKFNSDILSNTNQIGGLIKVLRKIPKSRLTILHGNPYFHSVFVDYKDGSVTEILVLDKNKINILPQGRTTVRALQRICSFIFYDFREGDLVEG